MKPTEENGADFFTRTPIKTAPAAPKYPATRPKIDKKIPLPAILFAEYFPFGDMELGDSFFEPCRAAETTKKCRNRTYQAFLKWKKDNNSQYHCTTAITTKDGLQGVRLWLIENKKK